jgi:hypothetical protein
MVIQSKMDELESQFKALLSLTKKGHVLMEDSLLLPAYPGTGADLKNYHAGYVITFLQDFEEEG